MERQYILVEEELEPTHTGKKIAGAAIALGVLGAFWIAKEGLSAAIEMAPTCVQVENPHHVTEGGVTRIRGTMKNGCAGGFGTVMVFFKLHDADGKVVGSTQAARRNLNPGETWDFETPGFFSAPNYELDHFKAY